MSTEVSEIYGRRVRVRACGLCWDSDKLLLVKHRTVGTGTFWSPPGGGVEFSQNLEETLKREFLEETGLEIKVGDFRFGCEFIQAPLHAIELFFDVTAFGGTLRRGSDPELDIIEDVQYQPWDDILKTPLNEIHGVFRIARSVSHLNSLSGFYRI